MDTLTHALSGALLARATSPKDAPPRSLPRRIAAGFFSAAFPDSDIVVSLIGPVAYLENHRGVTHSVLLLPLWAFLIAWALGFFRWFAVLPAFDAVTAPTAGSQCVWFVDLRFIEPGRPWVPFNFGACRENSGAPWRAYERTGPNERKLLR